MDRETKARSGLQPLFHLPLLNEWGSFVSWTRESWFVSAQFSSSSPSWWVWVYPGGYQPVLAYGQSFLNKYPMDHFAILCCDRKSRMCTKLHTVAASNSRDHPTRSLCYCLFAQHTYIFVLRAHPVRVESHNQRNTTREVATPDTSWMTSQNCTAQRSVNVSSRFMELTVDN